MICSKCNNEFPGWITIGGKKRNCQRRKYCFECSPFGQHNTRSLEETSRACKTCGKKITRKNEKGSKCWVCTNKENREEKIRKIQAITGDSCWICGYNQCWEAMDFHHVDPSTKSFQLTTRELQYAWDRVLNEVKKCVLTCCRCHREIHAGLIPDEKVASIWMNNWDHSSMVRAARFGQTTE